MLALSVLFPTLYIALDAVKTLISRDRPEQTVIGIAITLLSLEVMMRLARAKRRTAVAIGSKALVADSFQTTACWWSVAHHSCRDRPERC